VIEVDDPFRPAGEGRYAVDGGRDGATCARTSEAPDLALGVHDLGALYLGGVSATTLARAGRVDERRPGALRAADVFFSSPTAPWCNTPF